jgi:hypothetical protein
MLNKLKDFSLNKIYEELKPLIYATIFNMAILSVWFILEYLQFGELQFYQKGDIIVNYIYLVITYLLFREIDKKPSKFK